MRTRTGQALLTAMGVTAPADAPQLSALLQRAVGTRLAANEADLSQASGGPPGRRLRVAGVDGESGAWLALPSLALLAAHGGAGIDCLLRAGLAVAGAQDARRAWPVDGAVLVVARTSVIGLQAASEWARLHFSGASPGAALLGLVLIADAPGRLPRPAARLADLVAGGYPRTWQVPWLEEWRLAIADTPLPPHPEVSRLIRDLAGLDRSIPSAHRPFGDSA